MFTSLGIKRAFGSSGFFFTVTLHPAFFPLFEAAYIVVVPSLFAFTVPWLTEATELLPLAHVIDLFVAFDGLTDADKFAVSPMYNVKLLFDIETPVTAIVEGFAG